MTWFGISFTYIRFYAGLKAHGISRKELPFASSLQPFAAWYGMISTFVVCFFSGNSVFFKGGESSYVLNSDCAFIVSSLPILSRMGNGYFRYQLPPSDAIPYPVLWLPGVLQARHDIARGHGLCHRSERDRSRHVSIFLIS